METWFKVAKHQHSMVIERKTPNYLCDFPECPWLAPLENSHVLIEQLYSQITPFVSDMYVIWELVLLAHNFFSLLAGWCHFGEQWELTGLGENKEKLVLPIKRMYLLWHPEGLSVETFVTLRVFIT